MRAKYLLKINSAKFGVMIDNKHCRLVVGGMLRDRDYMEYFIINILNRSIKYPKFRGKTKISYQYWPKKNRIAALKKAVETAGKNSNYIVYSGVRNFGRLMR